MSAWAGSGFPGCCAASLTLLFRGTFMRHDSCFRLRNGWNEKGYTVVCGGAVM
jgi:hypothetical protein